MVTTIDDNKLSGRPSRRKPGSKPRAGAQAEAAAAGRPVTDFPGHTQEILTNSFAAIMEAMVQESIKGSLPHTKYLFHICGLEEELRRQAENNGEPTLADLLLEGVTRHHAPDATFSGEAAYAEANARNTPAQTGNDCGARAQ